MPNDLPKYAVSVMACAGGTKDSGAPRALITDLERDLATTTPMIQPTKVDELPWLESIVEKRPDLLRDFSGRMG